MQKLSLRSSSPLSSFRRPFDLDSSRHFRVIVNELLLFAESPFSLTPAELSSLDSIDLVPLLLLILLLQFRNLSADGESSLQIRNFNFKILSVVGQRKKSEFLLDDTEFAGEITDNVEFWRALHNSLE